jgi:hypothetical protein
MLTYQLHERVFRILKNGPLKFPNKLKVIIKLSPPVVFGVKNDYSRLVVDKSKPQLLMNLNTGRILNISEPPLPSLDVTLEDRDIKFVLKGDVLTYTVPCESVEQLLGCLSGLQYTFPAFLNLKFSDPPTINNVTFILGDTEASWEHKEVIFPAVVRSKESLEEHVAEFMNFFPLIFGTKNRRLAAAIYYFYISSRLTVAGQSQWEFMAESILNYCKTLEILFGPNMDSIRKGLGKLGYEKNEIEGDYIPIVILRNSMDVAHPRTSVFPQDSLGVLYKYLGNTENRFRTLLDRVITAVRDGYLKLPEDESLELNEQEKKKFAKLIEVLKDRNPTENWLNAYK